MERRDFLKWLGGTTAALATGALGFFSVFRANKRGQGSYSQALPNNSSIEGFVGHKHHTPQNSEASGFLRIGDDGRGAGEGLLARTGNSYGSMVAPPSGLGRFSLRAFENPLRTKKGSAQPQWEKTQKESLHPEFHSLANPIDGMPFFQRKKRRDITIELTERFINVAQGVLFRAWTYNGMLPGPVIRAREGETLHIQFVNKTDKPHNLHFHGTHSVKYDGWRPVPPGGRELYQITAGPVGIHPYHCHVPPLDVHMSKGLFGALIVDPPEGRPPAHEQVLILHGFDLQGRKKNDLYAWNGIAGFYDRYPIRVQRNELVRIYLLNMLEFEPVASFHLHAQTFDVYFSGTRAKPDTHTDIVTLGQTERAILEFRLPERGRYMFHPHQIHIASHGTMGWIVAI